MAHHLPTSYAPHHPLYTTNLSLLEGDVGVFADAFEECHNICMKPPKHENDRNTRLDIKPQLLVREEGNWELDPAHYLTAPQLAWAAILKQTRVQLELLSDPEMDGMFATSMGGGIFMISGR